MRGYTGGLRLPLADAVMLVKRKITLHLVFQCNKFATSTAMTLDGHGIGNGRIVSYKWTT